MEKISFLDCLDESNLPEELRTLLQERFPGACEMMMKEGGDFPYLSNPQEFCMLLQVHLRRNGLFPRLQLSPEELHKEQELMRQAFVGSDGFDLPASGSGNGSVNGGGGGGNYGDEVKVGSMRLPNAMRLLPLVKSKSTGAMALCVVSLTVLVSSSCAHGVAVHARRVSSCLGCSGHLPHAPRRARTAPISSS